MPGTKYDFHLYYSNISTVDKLTWRTSITIPGCSKALQNVHSKNNSSESDSDSVSVLDSVLVPFSTLRLRLRGDVIVWFRKVTTLLVLWKPPNPAGHYSNYKVSIQPEDVDISEFLVPREGWLALGTSTVFHNLVPGRVYNTSVASISKGQVSHPTTAHYRAVPLRPNNGTIKNVGSKSLTVS